MYDTNAYNLCKKKKKDNKAWTNQNQDKAYTKNSHVTIVVLSPRFLSYIHNWDHKKKNRTGKKIFLTHIP